MALHGPQDTRAEFGKTWMTRMLALDGMPAFFRQAARNSIQIRRGRLSAAVLASGKFSLISLAGRDQKYCEPKSFQPASVPPETAVHES